ncbi:MAG: hypothetical protein MUF28_05315 [Ignavibacterium sp.]|nr:hypothetical protein [Ignavibacterium sp.]
MEENSSENRICRICQKPLAEDSHGNTKAHKDCAYKDKKLRQKAKYKIGNSVKLMIQKNEDVAAHLYQLDKERKGIPHLKAMELGFKFDCPSVKRKYKDAIIYMFDRYGFSFETINNEILIFIYYEPDLD